jgi:hypothetical protein
MPEEKTGSVNHEKQLNDKEGSVNLGRHQSQCTVCSHPNRLETEEAWMNWGWTNRIARGYGFSRDTIYRHMHTFDLFNEGQKNIKWVLEKIIERVDWIDISGSQLVSAIQTYVKMNSAEQVIE